MNKSYHAIVNKSSDVTSSQIMTDKNVSSEIIIKANIPEQEKILPYEDINLEEHKDMGLPELADDRSSEISDFSSHSDEVKDIIEETPQNSGIPPEKIRIDICEKRVVTAGIPIRNFQKATEMQRKGLESARTARKMMNIDTKREILGNVWINDFNQRPKEEIDNETKELIEKSTLGNKLNHKNSTNYEEMGWDEYEQILRDNQDTDTMNKDQLKRSHNDSLFLLGKFSEHHTFSSIGTNKDRTRPQRKEFEIDISNEFSDLEMNKEV